MEVDSIVITSSAEYAAIWRRWFWIDMAIMLYKIWPVRMLFYLSLFQRILHIYLLYPDIYVLNAQQVTVRHHNKIDWFNSYWKIWLIFQAISMHRTLLKHASVWPHRSNSTKPCKWFATSMRCACIDFVLMHLQIMSYRDWLKRPVRNTSIRFSRKLCRTHL